MPSKRNQAYLAGVLMLWLCGCSHDVNEPIHHRMIEPATLSTLSGDDLYLESTVAEWPPIVGPDHRTGWAGDGLALDDRGGIELAVSSGEALALTRAIRTAASDIDLIVVRTSEPVKGLMTFYWTPATDRFRQERSLLAEQSTKSPDGTYETRFVMRGVPGWEAVVGRVRLIVRAVRGEPVRLSFLGLEARRADLRVDVAETIGSQPWRVEIGDETRDGLPCLPGASRRWVVPPKLVGVGARLRFGFGTESLAGGGVRFEIGSETEQGINPVWADEVDGGQRDDDVWHDDTLDLETLPAALTLTCHHDGGPSTTRALAHWSNLIVTPHDSTDDRPNIVIISIDTLRPDRLSLHGYERETSPNLDRWSQQAVVFEHTVTSAPWTLPAHLSMLSGFDATRHGVNHPVEVPERVPLLAEQLREAGYVTAAWVGGGFMSPRFGLDRGFDRYRSWPERAGEKELEDGLGRALAWLEASPAEPYFLFFHTYETHYPYRPREPFYTRWAPDEDEPRVRDLAYISEHRESHQLTKLWRYREGNQRRAMTEVEALRLDALYDSGVAYADQQLASLLERLTAPPYGRRTAVVVTSDHGEALDDKGLAGHAYLEDFNSLVPLILRLPDGRASGRTASQVRIADVAPTLLELAGIAPPPEADGVSLLSLVDESEPADRPASTYAAFSNRGLAVRPDRRWKLVFVDTALEPLAAETSLFDLEADPNEVSPVSDPERSSALGRLARREIATMAGVFRIHLNNTSAGSLEGRLFGPAIGPLQLKLAERSSSRVELDGQPGVRWRVEAGERLTLLVQNPPEAQLSIDVEGSLVATLRPDELAAGWKARRVDGQWTTSVSSGRSDASIEIEWPEGLAATAADPSRSDEALRRQLEALGYVQ